MTKKANLLRSRKTPFTEAGIGRVPCARCGAPSSFQWQICADGSNYRGLCTGCDVALNALVLEFVGHPKAKSLMRKYRSEKLGDGLVLYPPGTRFKLVPELDPVVLKAQAEFVKAMDVCWPDAVQPGKVVHANLPPVGREHTASEHCWCSPEVDYVDPETKNAVYVHRSTQ